ncbi:hypothetical protein EJ05DRAFT_140893 [Pseudovirgaria hyperparasitica]|uniref:Transglycosylase SLT domain-containing protein n=1 Tax=Pseudovirgaria hyperparasitica TaxID=470096 RepID=A0A6A6VXJ7_9PEZI|nr:uncharacterized protein EJ05DRAFT_140893 [Pseudovirgaria hyperparasitica]KAF2754414.1 hypothetical protein EJ05DRAFT_140893 [Pseudovirgaria hyperparasitica]
MVQTKAPAEAYGVCTAHSNELLLAWYSSDSTDGKSAPSDPDSTYTCVTSGKIPDFPAKTQWVSFDAMWEINKPVMMMAGTNEEEAGFMKNAITEVSQKTQIDKRLILAEIMQESTGNVHVHCMTEGSGSHCGLMQAGDGSQKYDPADPNGSIKAMIKDGVCGIAAEKDPGGQGKPGLLHYFNGGATLMGWIDQSLFGTPYAAARMYNSGSISNGNLNISPFDPHTRAYANDIANRLQGWNGGRAGCDKSVQCGLRSSCD